MTRSKNRKNSGQDGNSPLSPTNVSDQTEKPGAQPSSGSSAPFPSEPPSNTVPPLRATMSSHSSTHIWSLIQTLPEDLHVFLEEDYEAKYKKILKAQFYRILVHFDPKTTSRISHLKADLNAAFKKSLRPLLSEFMIPCPPPAMETDEGDKDLDFNPLGRKTTRKMLLDAIKRKAPNVPIPTSARRGGLLLLYKQHVDKDLVIPGQTETIRKPSVLKANAVSGEDSEELRLALQCYAPQVFVHSIPMTHQVLVDCYLQFILAAKLEPGALVAGFHYSIIS
ncbi:uncharacterized protein MELLADRAFT_66844 [Melampsora larici-populina 98AG31]|uniref:Uncharacterized protein n=1 Tax=Melampsora larici-populina (strain 98AG31 / pathotype 3-4-7) TaxID=747676 RepID=F4S0T3_MELLP|nr:uncharacterized protein MELLADRAFT_66844 [Melampsora larici-populina 98AG31]EGG01750.1 hypothetical protein MELLADRAFT_66844 [Melampsora larici-populina 98AG31]